MKKYIPHIILIIIAILLYLIINKKIDIEKITNNYLYSDNPTLPPDPRIIKYKIQYFEQ
jgi:hypothetical protein